VERILELVNGEQLVTRIVEFLPRVVTALVMLAVFLAIYRVTRVPIVAALQRTRLHEKLIDLLIGNIYRYVLMIFGIVMALDQLGVNVGAALAGLGVAGIAVGFAAQDSIANVIAGFLIFWDQPFIVGDWIKVNDEFGQVADITLRTTRIRTNRNTYVVIPNKSIIDAVLENFTHHGEIRVEVPVGIAYKENIPAARKVLLERVGAMDGIRREPAPDVVVMELGGSSVNLLVRVWIDEAAEQPATFSRVMEESKLALDAAGIQIPYPHLQLFVENVENRVWEGLDPVLAGAGRGSGTAREG